MWVVVLLLLEWYNLAGVLRACVLCAARSLATCASHRQPLRSSSSSSSSSSSRRPGLWLAGGSALLRCATCSSPLQQHGLAEVQAGVRIAARPPAAAGYGPTGGMCGG
jgi:hypothetical protein